MKEWSCLCALLGAFWASCVVAANPPIVDPVYTHAAALVDIGGGRHLNLYCTGHGAPTLVMDAGMGDSTISWALVQPALAHKTRVCSFDRAGLGFSDAATRAGTPANATDDLHKLLVAAGIKPPYVLVAHSLGGLNARMFADRYRNEVVGMVLVEPSQEDQFVDGWAIGAADQKSRYEAYLTKAHACIDEARKGLVPGTDAYTQCVGDDDDPQFSAAINAAQRRYASTVRWQAAVASERENVASTSVEQVRQTRSSFADMPLVVLTHSPFPKRDDETQTERDLRTLSWERLHTKIAALSTRGINIIVPDSGHYIQYDHPQVVIDAVVGVLATLKAD